MPIPYLVVAALSLLLLSACQETSQDDANEPLAVDPVAEQLRADALNIGAINSARSRRNGVLLGVERINQVGGVLGRELNAVALVASSTDEAVTWADAMFDANLQIVDVSFSSRSQAVAARAAPRQRVVITDSGTSPTLTDFADDDYLFRLPPSDVYQGRVLAELARNAGATRAAVVLNQEDVFGENLSERFIANFEALGGVVAHVARIPLEQSAGFRTDLEALHGAGADVILYAFLNPEIAANFLNEGAAYGFNGLNLFADAIAGKDAFINNLADLAQLDGALGTSGGFGKLDSAEYQFFQNAYREQFGLDPQAFNATAYDYVFIAALAIEHAAREHQTDSPTGEMIRDSLRAVMNPPGQAIGPSTIATGLALVRSGEEVDYTGAYGATDWDRNGDVIGQLVYNILRLDATAKQWRTTEQQVIEVRESP